MSGPASGKEIVLSPLERLLYASRIASKASLDDGGCLVWSGAAVVSMAGERRPVLKVRGVSVRSHRLAVACVRGSVPPGMVVSHLCDNPMCVRPSHLKVSTQGWNMADRDNKGRGTSGRSIYSGKMSKDDVARLLGMVEAGMSHRQIGNVLGISGPAVSYWRRRKHTPACVRGTSSN